MHTKQKEAMEHNFGVTEDAMIEVIRLEKQKENPDHELLRQFIDIVNLNVAARSAFREQK